MAEWIAGKTFRSAEEAEAEGKKMPTPEEEAEANRILDEWNATLRAQPRGGRPVVGGRFSDDVSGTEFDGYKNRGGSTPPTDTE